MKVNHLDIVKNHIKYIIILMLKFLIGQFINNQYSDIKNK